MSEVQLTGTATVNPQLSLMITHVVDDMVKGERVTVSEREGEREREREPNFSSGEVVVMGFPPHVSLL